ncbi:MAG: helix-turn-helix domain-containing protein [Ruminococcaceae bacterium]|nr:helix-turn-helix domain-containing protein [Oscillospiraceae bacterium]
MLITDRKELERFDSCHRIWQGIPGIVRTKKGRTFVSFYSGDVKETYGNYALVIKSDSDNNFSEPVAAAFKTGKYRCFDPVLWIDPLGHLWFIWNVMPGEQVMAAICDDPDAEALVWGEEFLIGRGIMMNKPVVLSSGEWLFPIAIWKLDIYHEFRASALTEDDIAGSYVYKTSDNGKTFIKLGGADMRDRSFDEHMVIELENGVLMMLVRTNYGIGRCFSYDRGKNWSVGENSRLGGPCSRFFISRLKSGRILLINHVNFTKRNNLTALLSDDDGKTFPYSLLLDERAQVSYPDAVESDDGYIYIVYDRERGCYKKSVEEAYASAREILTAKITEDDIINGSLVSEKGFLKNVVCKLERLSDKDPDPYAVCIDNKDLAEELIKSGETDIVSKIFELYPIDCRESGEFDHKKLDTLINRFNETDKKDAELLVNIIDFIKRAPKRTDVEYPIVDKVKSYIDEHLCEDFSVSDIAQSINVSVYYLSHLFKSVTGTTVIEYRNEARLTKAKLMLINTDEAIGNIAESSGFGGSAYFTEIFTRSEKIPPTEYRRLNKR